MAKFFGEIGFATQVQTEPGIWEDKIVEKQYYGDVFREARRFGSSDEILGSINPVSYTHLTLPTICSV